jgi:hypothetical protein
MMPAFSFPHQHSWRTREARPEFDMSQFTQEWSMSRLIGAEPGYVGYGDRGGPLAKIVEENLIHCCFFKTSTRHTEQSRSFWPRHSIVERSSMLQATPAILQTYR